MKPRSALGEELWNIYKNGPVWPGDTISHGTANELVRQGLVMRNKQGDFIVTEKGKALVEVIP